MNVSPISPTSSAATVAPEELAGNKTLTEQQKIAEASRQFEAIMLRQILSESQKPVITSEFTDNSTAAGIYQDFITNTLADSISKSGTFGFAKVFEKQLTPHVENTGPRTNPPAGVQPANNFAERNTPPLSAIRHE
jgi:Rod binding domain-containing protein